MMQQCLECFKFDWWDDEALVFQLRDFEEVETIPTIREVCGGWPAVNYIPENRKGSFP